MNDASEFLQSYQTALEDALLKRDIPPIIKENFLFDSLVKQQDEREVYFVSKKVEGQRCVLRITPIKSAENACAEAVLLQKLDHPSIPKLIGAWEYKGNSYLVREYFAGDDLAAYIRKRGTLGFDLLCDIALQLCDVLHYLHNQSPPVIHRDIKPENIILGGKNDVRLIDFGIARDMKAEAESDTRIAGTRLYMAPEQFGSEQTDCRADIYSLGIVMLYMAVGSADKKALQKDFPFPALAPIIRRCIRKDREQRFQNAKQLKKRILWMQGKKTRKLIASLLALLCMALSFAGGYLLGKKQGFDDGKEYIMSSPAKTLRPFTQEELGETLHFESEYLDLGVRNALNMLHKDKDAPIYRYTVHSGIHALSIYGTHIPHPSLDEALVKKDIDRGNVNYFTESGLPISARGDVRALNDIPSMYYLKKLALTSQNISDLTPLAGMKIQQLLLCDNFIANLLPLKDMVMLQKLDISQNPITDLTPLSRLSSLKTLDISHTLTQDIAPLSGLKSLETLRLAYCDISDISALSDLTQLKQIDISHSRVTDLRPLLRKENPIRVRCAGIAPKWIAPFLGRSDIIIIKE